MTLLRMFTPMKLMAKSTRLISQTRRVFDKSLRSKFECVRAKSNQSEGICGR